MKQFSLTYSSINSSFFFICFFSFFRTLYIEGKRKLDFSCWCAAIQAAAGSGGDRLHEQQLTETDIPVIVDSCINYITQCGKKHTLTHIRNHFCEVNMYFMHL